MIKWPRHYAAEYLLCKDNVARQQVADSVPDHLKTLVRLHIKINRERKKWLTSQK